MRKEKQLGSQQPRAMILNSLGMTLMSMMVAVAIGSIVTLTLGTVMNNLFRLSARTDALVAADQSTRLIYSIISNKTTCSNALRTLALGHVAFDPAVLAQQPVPVIAITRGANVDVIQFTAGQAITNTWILNSMTLSEVSPGNGRSTTFRNHIKYSVYNAQLTLHFTPKAGVPNPAGGSLPDRAIPITVAVAQTGPTAGLVDDCYINESVEQHSLLCTSLGGTWDQPTSTCSNTVANNIPNKGCAPAACGVAPPTCGYINVITSFDPSGMPVCSCQQYCQTPLPPPPTPPPTIPGPPVTIPSPTPAKSKVIPGPPIPAPPGPAAPPLPGKATPVGAPGFVFGT